MQGSKPVSPALQAASLPLSHLGSLTEFQLTKRRRTKGSRKSLLDATVLIVTGKTLP